MPKTALTAAAVDRIKPPKTGQVDHFDKGYPGLALRVSYGGSKAWVHFYRFDGKPRRRTLGRYVNQDHGMSLKDARDLWRADRENIAAGINPASITDENEAPRNLIDTVLADWLKRDQAGNRSFAEVERVVSHDLLPAWKGRMVETITRRDAIELIDGIADRGAPTMARRVHAYLHRFFRWCVGRDIIATNPMAELPKSGVETSRDRILSDDELARVWWAARSTPYPFGSAVLLLILTAARREEIASLRLSEVQGDAIRLEGERTKNGEPHSIPLAPQAQRILTRLPRIGRGDRYLFTTTGDSAISGWSKAKRLLDAKAAMTAPDGSPLDEGMPLPAWRIHDLRRTVATCLQRLGFRLEVIEAVLNHVSGSRAGIVGVYQRHGFEAEKREALEAWARHVDLFGHRRVGAKVREHLTAHDVADAKRADVKRERQRELIVACRKGGKAWIDYLRDTAHPVPPASNVVALHG